MSETTTQQPRVLPKVAELDRFVARQPILDVAQKTVAYELLFRSGTENFFSHHDGEEASSQLIHSSMLDFGLTRLTGGKKAFINVTRGLLLGDTITALPADEVVIEILETVTPDDEVVQACRKLKRLGYELALDDFVSHPELEPFVALADIVKIDFLLTQGTERERISEALHSRSIRLLAEKVEDHAEFLDAQRLGYSYFQGYFFCRPEITTTRAIPGSKLKYLEFLREVNRAELDLDCLTDIIKSEVSLSFKLLRYINSWAVAVPYEVKSIKQGLMLLGSGRLQKWGSLIAAACMCKDKPTELLLLCLVRARFDELIGPTVAGDSHESEFFLTGMLSGVDALLDRPLADVLDEVSVSDAVKGALLGRRSPLRPVHQLAVACEQGDWEQVSGLAARMKIPEKRVSDAYRQASNWADEILSLDTE